MMSISNKDALEQWRLLYGESTITNTGRDEATEELSEGTNDIGEQPKAPPDGAAG